MRQIRRGPCPAVLDGPESLGGEEHRDATTFFSDRGNWDRSYPKFNTYQDPAVRAQLIEDFGDKCCYCESVYSHVSSGDIEHYRPKGGYRGSDGRLAKPGYYWLSADWHNLLLSCIDCNRARRHPDDCGHEAVTGKASHFPLMDESARAAGPGGEARESPLLLNPCTDPVEQCFEFTAEGAIRPARNLGPLRRRAEATIEIIGLQRPRLAKRRSDRMIRVEGQIASYRRAVAQFAEDDSPGTRMWVESEIADLKNLWADNDEFSVMVRRRIEEACPEAVKAR